MFLFTRSHDVWELALPAGLYRVTVCIGDAAHEQFEQNVTVEGQPLMRDVTTRRGRFLEKTCNARVTDGRLSLEIGLPDSETNTCLNWIIIEPGDH